ncbi:ACT domain-containing protein [Roseibium sp.]|uniref:ACT domain-containing protein n=1 Tax=Roseibium sp. TaxID=1936156 RepID=UPI003A974989
MAGEADLQKLIAGMRPELDPEVYVFCTFADTTLDELARHRPLAMISEAEGITAIVSRETARQLGVAEADAFRRITLTVHSALEAVGLTAAVSAALASAGIPANVVAAYFHDHVFVPDTLADKAMAALKRLTETVS